MKLFRLIATIPVIFLAFSGCTNAQKDFCAQASERLCGLCEKCGGDYAACGLKRTRDHAECVTTLRNVCSAYDGDYNKEVARSCLSAMGDLSCDALKANGKPEVCTRLF